VQGIGIPGRNGVVIELELRRRAVDAAYRAHAADVYRVALAIIRDPDVADELLQETFTRAFDRWEQYDPQRPLRAWLHGIVSHAALDHVRRDRIRRLAAFHWSRSRPVLTDASAPTAGRMEALEEALDELPPRVRGALVLRHAYGYDYATIATLLETSAGNVGSMLSRAHGQLRGRLAGREAGADRTGRGDRHVG
jgi:RNA polymerase sigma-70 factor (ECF subfamily)